MCMIFAKSELIDKMRFIEFFGMEITKILCKLYTKACVVFFWTFWDQYCDADVNNDELRDGKQTFPDFHLLCRYFKKRQFSPYML